ncbi:MAG: MFS transporter [Pseudomonadota bacterium]
MTATDAAPRAADIRLVVAASAAGTAFEWYDFFVFGTLASIIARQFTGTNETAGFIFALGAFAAGFFVRPFGALFFGHIGDRTGRKGAFLITIVLMGLATIGIGLLPTVAQAGMWAPALLVLMRVIQGFAMGGEYGGAAIYVAEHSDPARRGFFTSWIQTTASLGLILALLVIFATRSLLGEDAFQAWGWRVPFLLSAVLLGVSLWIRLQLEESPVFRKMKAEQGVAKAPLAEAFGKAANLRLVLLALVAIMFGQGAVWYTAHFYAQFFLERVLKVDAVTVNLVLSAAVLCSAPLYVFFGWLSDRLGRKPVMLTGMLLVVVSLFPAFHLLTAVGNPGLADAARRAPVIVVATPESCALQFDVLGRRAFTSACDVAKRLLSNAGVPYVPESAPAGASVVIRIGAAEVPVPSLAGMDAAGAAALRAATDEAVKATLRSSGYPLSADPARVNELGIFGVLLLLMIGAAALYGPQAAALVELFPTRIRYSAFSLPYNVGTGWIGGFLPVTAFAMVAASGDLYFGLWYPLVFTSISVLAMLFLLPETRGRPLH